MDDFGIADEFQHYGTHSALNVVSSHVVAVTLHRREHEMVYPAKVPNRSGDFLWLR